MKEDSSNVMAFDALYTNNQIQKLKVLLPYIEPSMQKNMAVYIKYLELRYTMDFVRNHPFQIRAVSMESIEPEKPDIKKICRELKPYCTQTEIRQLEQMESIFQTMEMYQEMSQTMSAMQEMFPDMGTDNSDGASTSPSMEDILMGMLSPEQKAMYENFSK